LLWANKAFVLIKVPLKSRLTGEHHF